jgi:hypothetical protein
MRSPLKMTNMGGWLPRPSGLALRFKARAPRGERIVALEVHGKPVQDDAIYTVAACEREGDHEDTLCRIPHVSEPKVLDLDAHQAVRRYLAQHSLLTAPTMGRVVAVDLPANMHSQFFGVLGNAGLQVSASGVLDRRTPPTMP